MMMPEETTTSPYSVSIDDPETARSLFREGATLLFLNVPLGTLIGLDGQVRVSLFFADVYGRASAASASVEDGDAPAIVVARWSRSLGSSLAHTPLPAQQNNNNNRSSPSAPTSWASR